MKKRSISTKFINKKSVLWTMVIFCGILFLASALYFWQTIQKAKKFDYINEKVNNNLVNPDFKGPNTKPSIKGPTGPPPEQ